MLPRRSLIIRDFLAKSCVIFRTSMKVMFSSAYYGGKI